MVTNGTRLLSCFRQESGGKTRHVLPDPSGGLHSSLQAHRAQNMKRRYESNMPVKFSESNMNPKQ